MQIVLIILAIIGLIKIISTILIIGISLVHFNNTNFSGITRLSCFYTSYKSFDKTYYIIPTISYSLSGKYFEISFNWLIFVYYSCYSIEKEE